MGNTRKIVTDKKSDVINFLDCSGRSDKTSAANFESSKKSGTKTIERTKTSL